MTGLLPVEEANEELSTTLADLALAAGGRYEVWRFGSADEARSVLVEWVRRPTSEVAAARWTVAEDEGSLLGGFAILRGAELVAARRADTLALARRAVHDRSLMERLAASKGLFDAVGSDELYLSRVAVVPAARGGGVGRLMLERVIEIAIARGCRSVRLDVLADNGAAVHLYDRLGFSTVSSATLPSPGLHYLAMALKL